MRRLAVFISGGGTNLQAIIDSINNNEIDAKIALVLASNESAYGIERAKKHNIPYVITKKNEFNDIEKFGLGILENLFKYKIDYIVLAGYLNIIPENVVRKFPNKIINIHPSLIPSFSGGGYYGQKVHKEAINYGVKITGATVHFVDEGIDTGPIILQDTVRISEDDTAESLSSKVLNIEHNLLVKAIRLLVEDRLKIDGRKVYILPKKE